ncbi:VOC family protein [Bradyrhizobium jicamae]|uniref:VOC family protein n=1 Tax=Bradyrhizobium jicamae TaxID=280332 RepID=UPI001BA4EF81|nr:VOC family protein [Bradyrhizobium jicamae]MBR0755326.1 VOC family protein [Bradyrhizobium jicamae]
MYLAATKPNNATRTRRLADIIFETPDIERLLSYYVDTIGLSVVERTPDAVYLGASSQDYCVVLKPGAQTQCNGLSFQISPEEGDLGALHKLVQAQGIAAELRQDANPSINTSLHFKDPKGTNIEVFAKRTARSGQVASRGIGPEKLGHVAFSVTDVNKIVRFYVDVLGFRESDWIGDFFAFLRCSPDHHTVNFVRGKTDKMHHVAFELKDWAHVQTACETLGKQHIPLLWGPGRHGVGHNIFTYHRDTDGHIVELFTEIDRIHDEDLGYFEPRPWHEEVPQRPKVWPPGLAAANQWGIEAPHTMLEG